MEAQRKGMQEAEYYSVLKHKNIIYCLEHVLVEDANNALHSSRFIFYMVFPYYPVIIAIHVLLIIFTFVYLTI